MTKALDGIRVLDFTWGAVRASDALIGDGHLADRGFWVDVEHPALGRSFKYPAAAELSCLMEAGVL